MIENRHGQMLAIARNLLARGFSVIPVDHPDETRETDSSRIGKVPTIQWKQFQSTKPTDEHLQRWFGNGHQQNIGIVTGAVSGVVVVDCDSPEAVAWADAHLPPTTMRQKTRDGREHRGYRHPGVLIRNAVRVRTGNPAVKIDVRGDGGYIVGPGSKHQTGTTYEPIGIWPPIDELPVFEPSWLEVDAFVSETRRVRRASERADQKTRLGFASAYIEKVAPAIQGDGGDARTFSTCCALTRGFDLTDDETFDLLRAWNQRCLPPWSDDDLRTKIRNAREHGTEPIGGRIVTFEYSEYGDAEYFAATFGAIARFDHARQRWLLTIDSSFGVWIPDATEQLRAFVMKMMRERQQEASAIADDEKRKRSRKWAFDGESSRRISNTLREARAVPPISDDGTNWDLDPWLVGTRNGVIDLRTGELRPGRPEDRVTMRTRVAYDPDAACPLWEQTLDEVFNGAHDLIDYAWRALGYSLAGDCREECFFVTWGEGANGKGTVMNTIAWVMGEYADDLPFSALEMRDRSSIPADIAKLVGKRFVTASESGEAMQLNEARIKALTGRDPITARLLHKNFFTFQPVAKFWLATNSKPQVRDDSDGFWRRVHLIPFTQSFVGRADLTLKDRLREEAPGILAWLVRGALAWQRNDLNPPQIVRAATEEYRRESEPVTPFIQARCVIVAHARVQAGQLFAAYRGWCDECGIELRERLNQTSFGRQMKKRFATDEGRHTFYVGVGLRDDQRPMPELGM